jgi:hypothetical protein
MIVRAKSDVLRRVEDDPGGTAPSLTALPPPRVLDCGAVQNEILGTVNQNGSTAPRSSMYAGQRIDITEARDVSFRAQTLEGALADAAASEMRHCT